jgi:hypothetical protein
LRRASGSVPLRWAGQRGATLEELLAERITGNIAAALDRAVERLSEGDRRKAWLTPEQAREYLGLTPSSASATPPRLPWRYLPERGVRYPVSELDAALEAAVRGDQRRQCSLRRENRRRRAGRGR